MQGPIILFVTWIVFYMVTTLPGLHGWRASITARGKVSLFIILPLATTFFGSTGGAQYDSLLTDVPRITRAILIMILFVASTLRIVQNFGSWKLAGSGARWMVYFYLLCIISAIWSVGPFVSFWKGLESLTLSLCVVSIASLIKENQDIKWLLDLTSACLLYLALSVIVGFVLYPSDATIIPDTTYTKHYFAVRGIVPTLNPASIGSISALLLISAFSRTLISKQQQSEKNHLGLWVVIAIAVIDMLLGHARTPIFACVIALMGMLYFSKKTKQMIVIGGTGTLLIVITSGIDFILSYIYRGQTAENFSSLTGRISFWQGDVFGLITNAPIVGSGYYAAFRETLNTASIDNTFFAVITGVGFLGLLIFMIPIIYGSINILKSRPRKKTITERDYYWLTIFGFMGILLIRALTATSFEVMHPLLIIFMIMQLIIAAINRPDNSINNYQLIDSGNKDASSQTNKRILEKKQTKLLHSTHKNNR